MAALRFENRYRVFKQDTLLNPVLYLEYLQLETEHRYIKDVTGRAGGEEEEEEEGTEHELETKLIIGRDFSDRLDAAFNWISEVNLDTGDWGVRLRIRSELCDLQRCGR